MTNQIVAPTVHMNGTSRERLSDNFENAYDSIAAAMKVLQQSAPNARDYYVQKDDTFKTASEQHMARLLKLQDVMNELEFLISAVNS